MDYDLSTNMGRWKFFMKDRPAPEIFIEYGFVYVIAAALQRKIWYGHDLDPLYTNVYIILCGPVGLGKGLVTKQCDALLRYHKITELPKVGHVETAQPNKNGEITKEELNKAAAMANEILDSKEYEDNLSKRNIVRDKEQKLLIPVAGDASTYEALVRNLAKSFRCIPWEMFNEKLGRNEKKIYTHSSLCFVLDELASLFRTKHQTKDVVRFLLTAYSCGDYRYETKDEGKVDFVKKCCLNMLAGTNPTFMEESLEMGVVDEGYSSRAWFIWSNKNRFSEAIFADFNEEQVKARNEILEHIKSLSQAIGPVKYTDEATTLLRARWQDVERGGKRVNKHEKLDAYYARWSIHVQKMAMIKHFMDIKFEKSGKFNRIIDAETFHWAIEMLQRAELSTHSALTYSKSNPLAKATKNIERFIRRHTNGLTYKAILMEFYDDLPQGKKSLDEIIEHLSTTGILDYTENGSNDSFIICKEYLTK